jgi:hypothetical protein
MSTYVKAWQCIGCGKIEAPQTCIGICQDRKVQFVYAEEHEQALSALERANQELRMFRALARRLASTNPHRDRWEHSYRAMQEGARMLLGAASDGASSAPRLASHDGPQAA